MEEKISDDDDEEDNEYAAAELENTTVLLGNDHDGDSQVVRRGKINLLGLTNMLEEGGKWSRRA